MRRIFTAMATVLAAIALVLANPAQTLAKGAQEGAAAPDFSTDIALAGKVSPFNLAAQLRKGPVVLYFYPKAFTAGCTAEAHEFAEKTEAFAKAGATVIGLSGDKMEEIAKFSVEECRNKFAVGRASPAIIKSYGVAMGPVSGMSNRTSFVIGRDGKIKLRYSAMDYREHVTRTLAAVQALGGQ